MNRIVDLTLTLRPGMRGVDWEQAKTVESDGWNARALHLYSHAGTHMDAQTHFAAGPGTIDLAPLERCMGLAWVVNLDGIADKALITVADLGEISEKLQSGESLLLRTGWSQHVDNPQHYRDDFPRISEELADWCAEKQVNILGVEPPSVADVNNMEELTLIHKILLGANVTIVEGLTNLSALTQEKVFFVAAPLKIEGGDGCPCRAFAWNGDIPVAQSQIANETSSHSPKPAPVPLPYLNPAQVTPHRNRLPHWQQQGAAYFVTYRLADCLPESRLAPWRNERDAWLEQHPKPWDDADEQEYLTRFTLRIEHWLDEGHGCCRLRDPACAEIVASTLRHFDGEHYDLHAFVIMPNHVHVLFSLLGEWEISKVLHGWKSFSAQKVNERLGLHGGFWMKDYFDRSIRDAGHFERVRRYIERNPMKARLKPDEFILWMGDVGAAGPTIEADSGDRDVALPP